MKIFITGATGFIGTHLVKKLQEKAHSLLLLSQTPLEGIDFIRGDLSEINKWKNSVIDFQPDACIHLAWEALPDYSAEVSRKNINHGLDLFSFLTDIRCKTILSIGSAWEYRGRFPERAIEGTMLFKPADTFSAAKWITNLWGTAIIEEKNREINAGEKGRFIWARVFFIYGPGQRKTSLIPYLINCAQSGKSPEIKNPSAKNDFIYIDDVIEAVILLLENCKQSGEYDIGWGKLVTVQAVVNIVADKLNINGWKKNITKSNEIHLFSRPAHISRLEDLGWKPKSSLEQGIQKMIDFYLSKNI